MNSETKALWRLKALVIVKAVATVIVVTTILTGVFCLGYMIAEHNMYVSAVENGHGHWAVIDSHGSTSFEWN
jgi:hypothetical protein